MIAACILNSRLPFIQQVRSGMILQFRGTQAVFAPRVLPGFSTQLRMVREK